jgi:ribonucleoside-diphosphate reductase alpha chain
MTTRPDVLSGFTQKIKTACGNLYITVNSSEGKIIEVFANLGKAGTCSKHNTEIIGRLLTVALRKDADIKKVIKMIKGIGCINSNEDSLSCANAIAMGLETYLTIKENENVK